MRRASGNSSAQALLKGVAAEDQESPPSSEELGGSSGGQVWTAGSIWTAVTRRKSIQAFQDEAARDAAEGGARMTLIDLLCVGIGGTVGSGVFVLTGQVAPVAGPSATLSWALAGGVCGLSALSYMELSARVPTKGSCYAFAFHALGELPAVVGAVCLTLEYGLSGAGVARNWSAKLSALLRRWHVGQYLVIAYPGTVYDDESDDDYYVDVMAGVLQVLCVLICVAGLRMGKAVINSFTAAKCLLVAFMIIAGFGAWHNDVVADYDTFFPEGVGGTVTGASLLFFGFIGFDEVCCMAGKSDNPAQVMPRAIAGTLIGATLLSVLAQFALSGMSPLDSDSATSFEDSFKLQGWELARWVTAVGEVLLLPLVVLVSFLPQPELFAALAEDGLLPSSFAQHDANGTLLHGTFMGGVIMTLFSMLVPFAVLWDMINLGVLLGFNITNTSLLLVRYGCAGAPETATVAAAARTASRRSGETRDDVEDVSHTGKRAGGGERSSHDEGALANAWAEAWNQPSTSPPISPPNDGNVDSGLSMAPTSSGDNGGGAAGDSGGGAAGDAEEAAAGDNGGGAARDAEEAAAERAAADTTLLSFLKPAESSSQVLGGSMATPEEDVGPEQRLLVGQCLSGLWLFGSVGAYSSWWGFVHNLLEGTPAHAGLSTLGIIALLGFVACVVTIAQKCVQAKDDDDDDNINSARSVNALHSGVGGSAMADTGSHVGGLNPNHHQRLKSDLSTQHEDFDSGTPSPRKVKLFKAPGLPYVPAAALICNFSLMAQYDVVTHCYLGGLIGLSVVIYAWQRFS